MSKIKSITQIINSINQYDIDRLRVTTQKNKLVISKATAYNQYNQENLKENKKNIIKKKIRSEQLVKDNRKITINQQDKNITKISNTYSTIISPMVGTFYKSPAPNESAFVEIGDEIKQKQIVCIIEAMKLMNEIESEVKGEIVEVLVKDGDIVDCGQALMKVKVK